MQRYWLSTRRKRENQQSRENVLFISRNLKFGSKDLLKNISISSHLANFKHLLRKGGGGMLQRTIDTCHIVDLVGDLYWDMGGELGNGVWGIFSSPSHLELHNPMVTRRGAATKLKAIY